MPIVYRRVTFIKVSMPIVYWALSKVGHRAPCRGERALHKQRLGQRYPTGPGELYEWGTVVKKRTKKRTPTTTN